MIPSEESIWVKLKVVTDVSAPGKRLSRSCFALKLPDDGNEELSVDEGVRDELTLAERGLPSNERWQD